VSVHANLYITYAEAAIMARHNARRARRLAAAYPKYAERDLAEATEAFERGLRLLDQARRFRQQARVIALAMETEYAAAA
jgi:hypothetical protein